MSIEWSNNGVQIAVGIWIGLTFALAVWLEERRRHCLLRECTYCGGMTENKDALCDECRAYFFPPSVA